ncbi:hypothetical protein J3F83DRAFT_728865 [Trichoderma novae-zelandiae]
MPATSAPLLPILWAACRCIPQTFHGLFIYPPPGHVCTLFGLLFLFRFHLYPAGLCRGQPMPLVPTPAVFGPLFGEHASDDGVSVLGARRRSEGRRKAKCKKEAWHPAFTSSSRGLYCRNPSRLGPIPDLQRKSVQGLFFLAS